MLKIPGHAAYAVVTVRGGMREEEVIAANYKRNKTFRKTAVTIAGSLSWLPSFMSKALTLMRTHILRLEKTSFFWDMSQTVTVNEFVQMHRSAAKDAIGFLMSTLMDLMSDALLTAYSEEEALGGSAAAMSAHQRDKYCLVTKLANRMLSDDSSPLLPHARSREIRSDVCSALSASRSSPPTHAAQLLPINSDVSCERGCGRRRRGYRAAGRNRDGGHGVRRAKGAAAG
jgi:hypothetical protein